MPYINQRDRRAAKLAPFTPGELNYAITELCITYMREHGMSYSAVNAAVGALECAKLELYRRVAAPYEDKKITENGEVYPEEWTR